MNALTERLKKLVPVVDDHDLPLQDGIDDRNRPDLAVVVQLDERFR